MRAQIATRKRAILRAKRADPGLVWIFPTVNKRKATQQGAVPARRGCQLGCTRRRCTLAPPGEYDWTVRERRRCGLMPNYFDHLFEVRHNNHMTNDQCKLLIPVLRLFFVLTVWKCGTTVPTASSWNRTVERTPQRVLANIPRSTQPSSEERT